MTHDRKWTRAAYVLAHAADTHGCGYHRIMRPLQIMAKQGILDGRCDMQIWSNEHLQLLNPDVVVFQRQIEEHQIEHIARYRDILPNAFIVYEIDDALSLVPASSHHAAYMPIDVDTRMARAIKLCDAVTVTTRPLMDHIRKICGDNIDVRLVPNMIGRDDVANIAAVRAAKRFHEKPRIGWGGGISHKGDLSLITEAIEKIGTAVEWVFIGMKPDVSVPIEFHPGVPPQDYLKKLASVDLDLMLAPIEDNPFNRCKSNLRLIEGGFCNYPVISSPVAPYLDGNPPVFGYAGNPSEWIEQINRFIDLDADEQTKAGTSLRQFVERYYLMEEHLNDRMTAWMPKGAKPFRPRTKAAPEIGITVFSPIATPELSKIPGFTSSFDIALQSQNHILYVRPGASFAEDAIDRMRYRLERTGSSSVCAMSNDGGICGFPRPRMFSPMDPEHGVWINKICAEALTDVEADIYYPCGPLVLISRRALNITGAPEPFEGNVEASLVEWGIMTMAKGFRNRVAADVFVTATIQTPQYNGELIMKRAQIRWPPVQMNPDPLAEARARIELIFHREHYNVPIPKENGGYKEWASLLDTIGPKDMVAMRALRHAFKSKIAIARLGPNVRIDAQTYPAYEGNDPEWFVYVKDGSIVRSHALYLLAQEIESHPDARIIYCDQDVKDANGNRVNHDFKSEFDHDLLMARDYLMPMVALRAEDVMAAGGMDLSAPPEPEIYRIALQVISGCARAQIRHVPRILVHRGVVEHNKEIPIAAAKFKHANAHMEALGWSAKVAAHERFPWWGDVKFAPVTDLPLASIIIPTKDKLEMLSPCIATLLSLTTYPNYEIVVMSNNTTSLAMLEYLEGLKSNPKIRVVKWDHDYNWSAINNEAAKIANGTFMVFLNDDTRVLEAAWLGEMIGAASRDNIGAVGARLIYPHGLIQHVGVVARHGLCGHMFKGTPEGQWGYHGLTALAHEATAVTGACMLLRRSVFEEMGGFDESMPHNFNDVAICLKLLKHGRRNVVAMNAVLQHIEGATRPSVITDEGKAQMFAEGKILAEKYGMEEPYWNPNLIFTHVQGGMFVSGLNYDVLAWPPAAWGWRAISHKTERVLVIGDDDGVITTESSDGNPVFSAQIMGSYVRVIRPPLENTPAFDLRLPAMVKPFLTGLGIDRIVVRSMRNASIESLMGLTKLGIPLEYAPVGAEAACPRGDFLIDGKPCDSGWKSQNGTCQECIDAQGSSFGFVDINGWRTIWRRFLAIARLNLTGATDESVAAMRTVYPAVGFGDGDIHRTADLSPP